MINIKQLLYDLSGVNAKRKNSAKDIIGQIRPETEVDIGDLVSGLDSPCDDVVFWCLVGLVGKRYAGNIGMDKIRHIANSHVAFGIREMALTAIRKMDVASVESKKSIINALKDENPLVRREALQCCMDLENLSLNEFHSIKLLLGDPDPHVARWSDIAIKYIIEKSTFPNA